LVSRMFAIRREKGVGRCKKTRRKKGEERHCVAEGVVLNPKFKDGFGKEKLVSKRTDFRGRS